MKYLDTKKDSLEEAISKAMNGNNRPSADTLVAEGGKYLKYSDLLLQKGRLMAKNQSTAMIDKEIKKEMGKLGIKESNDEYKKFFNSALKKFGVDSPADFKDDDKKKEFFNYVDKNYKAKEEGLDKEDEKSVDDVVKGLKKAVKTHQGQVKSLTKDIKDETNLEEGRMKELHGYIAKGMSAEQISKKMNVDVKTIETLMKEDTMNKNVDETLDAIREANVAKQKSMREILADIWNMNEGKSPFELEEAPKMKNYKNEPNFFVNDKKDTLQKLMKDRRDGYGETDLANYLAQKTGKDPEDVYFDDDHLVYGSKTVMRGAHKQPIDKLLAKLKTIRSQKEIAPAVARAAAAVIGVKALTSQKKKEKKEELEKEGKTATGKKATKIEIEPEIK